MNGYFSTCFIKRNEANAIIFLRDTVLRKMSLRTLRLFIAM